MRKNATKPTNPFVQRLCNRRGLLFKVVFATVLTTSCCLVCVMIVKTNNTTNEPSTFFNTSEVVNHTKTVTLREVSERIRIITGNIRTPPNAESKLLYDKVRLLCLVMTMPSNHVAKARHVKATWGRRCNKLIFMSSATNPSLGSVNLNISEGHQYLWNKTQNAFEYVYEHYLNDSDWFLKADDDTYVIVENLRHFLRNYSSDDSVYFGYQFEGGSISGGAGYILSRRSVRLFVERGLRSGSCPNVSEAEDVQISACLKVVGVSLGDSRDSRGRDRFNPVVPVEALLESYEYYDDDEHPANKTEVLRCSDTAISFHYVQPWEMYTIEYFIYHLNLKGGPYPKLEPIAYHIP